jgi:hypothetical protein
MRAGFAFVLIDNISGGSAENVDPLPVPGHLSIIPLRISYIPEHSNNILTA